MTLTKTARRYEIESSYDERAIPKAAGCRWDPVARCWWTGDVKVAAKLAPYADDETRVAIEREIGSREKMIEESRAMDSDVEIPAPAGCVYRGFQKAGIAFCLSRPRVLLGDEMGVGKTIQALGVINGDETIRRVLVICPNTLKGNWKREAEKWLVRPAKIRTVNAGDQWPEGDGITIVNYDIIGRYAIVPKERGKDATGPAMEPWDVVIVDEATAVKNAKAKRSKAVRAVCGKGRRVLLLTGTPMLNRPIELWHPLQILDPETWKSWRYFVLRYCDAKETGWGWDTDGASNCEELGERLRSSVMIRRLKSEVLSELPPKQRQIIDIKNGVTEDSTKYEQTIRELEAAADEDSYGDAVSRLSEARRALFTEMARLRHETAVRKIPYVVDHVLELLQGESKVAVWGHHHDVLDGIVEGLQERGIVAGAITRIDGRTKNETRQAECDRFQTDPGVRVFVGGITAAGMGITLTEARVAVFAELDWVPGVMSQAEDRHHRIGQRDSVLIQHIVIDGSIDARLARTIVKKQEIIERTIDSTGPSIEIETSAPEERAAKAVKKARAKREEPMRDWTAEQVDAINRGLQILSGMCDGARSMDGAGFSKVDSEFGKSLAEHGARSPKQLSAGAKLVRKYRRQIPEEFEKVHGGAE